MLPITTNTTMLSRNTTETQAPVDADGESSKKFLGVLFGQLIKNMKTSSMAGDADQSEFSDQVFWDLLCENVGDKLAEHSLSAKIADSITKAYKQNSK